MTARRVLMGVVIALLLAAPACRRSKSRFAVPSNHVYELRLEPADGRDAGGAAPAAGPPGH